MQREKLYNLQGTSYFIIALFCFEDERDSERPDFNVAKMRYFLVKDEFAPSYHIFLSFDMFVYQTEDTI